VLLAVWAGISSQIRAHLDSFTLADIAAMARGEADWP
jgi:DNA-binding IscR family transcriptional regulator